MQRTASELVRSIVERLTARSRPHHGSEHVVPHEEELERLLRHVPGMIFRGGSDAARSMELVSQGSRDLLGFGPHELVWGKVVTYGALIHPDDRGRVQREIERAVLAGRPYRVEYRIRRVDGRERRVREQGHPVTREPGGAALEGFVMDLTGTAPTFAAAPPEELFRALGEHYRVGVYIVRDGRFEYVNAYLADVFGYRERELLELPSVQALVHAEDWAAVSQHMRRRLEGASDGLPYEFRGLRKDGSEITVEVIGQRLEHGGSPAIAGSLVDVTERRREERHAEEAKTLEAMGRWAIGVAHDLHNVLATIKGTAQAVLAERVQDAALARDLEEIVSAVDRGSALGRKLIEFGRSRPPGDDVVDLGRAVSELAPVLSSTLGPDIDVRLDFEPSAPQARIDALRVEEMLTVLSLNARQAMPEGGALTIRVLQGRAVPFRAGMKAGPYVLLEVSDTGRGLPPELKPPVFEPSLKSDRPSGLARLWRLAYDAGGCVDFESTPGKGTWFRVTLPAAPGR